ncbi:hypothetical protein CMEL01_06588 [Colletotrichum melonis]|uniref:Uncharacterized protein n=1 Tax=Colletotrichum melonis TaxID=1209925 RepID=A0AAI9U5E0_9PEZI|nr:hypothetical protein CMEL01_06588 [Colletotrichum melonis]
MDFPLGSSRDAIFIVGVATTGCVAAQRVNKVVGQAWMRYKAEVDAISMARNLARLDLGNDTKAIEETGAEQSSLPLSRPKKKRQRRATRRRIHYKEDTDGDISSDEGEDDDDDEDDDQSTVTEAMTDDGMSLSSLASGEEYTAEELDDAQN